MAVSLVVLAEWLDGDLLNRMIGLKLLDFGTWNDWFFLITVGESKSLVLESAFSSVRDFIFSM